MKELKEFVIYGLDIETVFVEAEKHEMAVSIANERFGNDWDCVCSLETYMKETGMKNKSTV